MSNKKNNRVGMPSSPYRWCDLAPALLCFTSFLNFWLQTAEKRDRNTPLAGKRGAVDSVEQVEERVQIARVAGEDVARRFFGHLEAAVAGAQPDGGELFGVVERLERIARAPGEACGEIRQAQAEVVGMRRAGGYQHTARGAQPLAERKQRLLPVVPPRDALDIVEADERRGIRILEDRGRKLHGLGERDINRRRTALLRRAAGGLKQVGLAAALGTGEKQDTLRDLAAAGRLGRGARVRERLGVSPREKIFKRCGVL